MALMVKLIPKPEVRRSTPDLARFPPALYLQVVQAGRTGSAILYPTATLIALVNPKPRPFPPGPDLQVVQARQASGLLQCAQAAGGVVSQQQVAQRRQVAQRAPQRLAA